MNQQRLFYWGGPTHQSYGIDPVLVTITDAGADGMIRTIYERALTAMLMVIFQSRRAYCLDASVSLPHR